MKHVLQTVTLMAAIASTTMSANAAQSVDYMSDIEVSEYAVRLSNAIEMVEHNQLCFADDIHCLRAEFAQYGVSYDDKEPVKKRLVLMIGGIF